MLSATVLAVIFVPVFFVVVFKLGHSKKEQKDHTF